MKAYLQLTISQLLLFARNRQVLIWTMLLPVILMVMLGSFVGNGGGVGFTGIVVDLDRTPASQTLAKALGSVGEDLFRAADSEEEALAQLEAGNAEMAVVIPQGYGELLAAGEKARVRAVYDETKQIQKELALAVLHQVTDGISKEIVSYEPVVLVEERAVRSLQLSYIDFLVPGIVAMMIMSNNLNGVAGQIASWRERGILRRMQSTPLAAPQFIAAQITARLILNGVQALLVLLIASLAFDVQMNGSWLLLIFYVALGTLAFMAIGFIIAGLARTPESAGPIAGVISFPLLFLGGVFFPIASMPEWFQPVVKALPIAPLANALRQVMNVGADIAALWSDTLLLALWMAAAFIAASFTFKWE